jgi:hypothetical protein
MCVKSYYSLETDQESLHELALELDDISPHARPPPKAELLQGLLP